MKLDNTCPRPVDSHGEHIVLAHGEGGRLSRQLIRELILNCFNSSTQTKVDFSDAACFTPDTNRLVISTDSYVVTPRFFPGGNIGELAIYGTVNDLAVSGAQPCWLTLGIILEEGFRIAELKQILDSIHSAADACGVSIVAGDTKVVPRGAVDGMFLHTTGVGTLLEPAPPGPSAIIAGDVLLVSGPIGRHGAAVITARESFGFTPAPESDCGNLWPAVAALHAQGITPRAMRDATRGGVAAVLHEWAEACGNTLQVVEDQLPITPVVRGFCELLGFDPLHLANEGTMVLAIQEAHVPAALAALRSTTIGMQACVIGRVVPRDIVPVVVKRVLGKMQPLDDPLGAPQPRIC